MVIRICKGCGKETKRKLSTGYCSTCFHLNVDSVKSLYNAQRWDSGEAKLSHWKHRGITLSEADVEVFNTTDQCEICGKSFQDTKKNLDHCHETGRYRGALCIDCNTSLGKLGDNLELVISRLQRYKDKEKW